MGIFDSYFAPQNYQGMGGLLSQLPMWQMQAGASQGFPADQGSLPPNAQPTSGPIPPMSIAPPTPAAPAAPAAPEPGFGDRLMAGFQGFARGGGGLLPAIAGAVEGMQTGQTPKNMTIRALMQRGLDENTARTVASDPGLMRAVLPQVMGIGGQTDDIKEYQFAKQQGFTGSLEQWMQRKRAGAGEYGLQGIWGTGKDGKPALIQLGKSGEAVQSKLPEGFQPAKDPIKVDLGTHWGFLDPQTRQMVTTAPKDLVGKEAAEAVGKDKGAAQAALPGAISDAADTNKKIDELLAHPGLDSIFGPIDQFRPSWTQGDQGRDATARLNQLKGTAFLNAYAMLRGGGAITEMEGQQARDAMARLDRAQGEAEARQALRDFKEAVDRGIKKLQARAGSTVSQSSDPAPIPPADGGYKVLGVR